MDASEQSKVIRSVAHPSLTCSVFAIDLNVHQFSIGDLTALGGEYQRGGIAREVKQQVKMNFVGRAEQCTVRFDTSFV